LKLRTDCELSGWITVSRSASSATIGHVPSGHVDNVTDPIFSNAVTVVLKTCGGVTGEPADTPSGSESTIGAIWTLEAKAVLGLPLADTDTPIAKTAVTTATIRMNRNIAHPLRLDMADAPGYPPAAPAVNGYSL
jgi:hypothetical protein